MVSQRTSTTKLPGNLSTISAVPHKLRFVASSLKLAAQAVPHDRCNNLQTLVVAYLRNLFEIGSSICPTQSVHVHITSHILPTDLHIPHVSNKAQQRQQIRTLTTRDTLMPCCVESTLGSTDPINHHFR